MFSFKQKTFLITGGTGTFGEAFVRLVLTQKLPVKKLIILSRDEYKQYEMQRKFPQQVYPQLQFVLGDIRNKDQMFAICKGVDVIIHAAAFKQLLAGEINPEEFIRTNTYGTENLMEAATFHEVPYVVGLSTDKAVKPTSLYGATKLCMEKIMVAANSRTETIKSFVVRLGNIFGSRGSVVPLFKEKKSEGLLPITHEEMTRFSTTAEASALFTLNSLAWAQGGEILVPRISSYRVKDLAEVIAPGSHWEVTGIRTGEKIHETLIAAEESPRTVAMEPYFAILPTQKLKEYYVGLGGESVPLNFTYTSNKNDRLLSHTDLSALLEVDMS